VKNPGHDSAPISYLEKQSLDYRDHAHCRTLTWESLQIAFATHLIKLEPTGALIPLTTTPAKSIPASAEKLLEAARSSADGLPRFPFTRSQPCFVSVSSNVFPIQELILWPKKPGVRPRRIRFELGKVNVITGASRTGKSAVTPIIDYCLGARTCAIPVKTIRDACAWFGVLVKTAQGEKLLARKEPGNQQGTDDMYVLEAANVVVPDQIPGKNSNADAVPAVFDELAGLTKLDFSAGMLAQ